MTNVNEVIFGSLKILRTCKTRLRNLSSSSFISWLSFLPNNIDLIPPEILIKRINLPDHASIISGNERNLKVCPVGAVSNTITSQLGSSTCFRSSSKASASSNPGSIISDVLTSDLISSISSFAPESNIMPSPPKPCNPPPEFIPSTIFPSFGRILDNFDSGSISKPYSPFTPSMGVGSVPISQSNESEVECAGSLETSRTLKPQSARCTAVAVEVVVFPTPPFPPNSNKRAIPCA